MTGYFSAVGNWWDAVNHESATLAFLALALVFLFRKPLANWVVTAVSNLISNLTKSDEGIGDETRERLAHATRVLLVAGSFLALLETLALPELAGGVVRRLVISAAIIAVFATWYELAGSFVSILRTGEFQDVALEADWTTRVTRFAIFLFGVTALLEVWEIDISGALTGVGVLGAGLAIAAQDLVRNLIAGMTNQSEDRFKKGDAIEIEGNFMGVIEKIDLRSTLVMGFDQVPRHVPNSELSNSIVKNFSRMRHRRVLVSIPLLLSSSIDQLETVRSGLEAYMRESGDFSISDEAPKYVHISGISDSSVEIMFYAWTNSGSYPEYLAVNERLSQNILRIVRDSGTDLAYPTQTLFVHTDEERTGPR